MLIVRIDDRVASFVNFEPNVHEDVSLSPLYTPRQTPLDLPRFIHSSHTEKPKRRSRSRSRKRRRLSNPLIAGSSSHHSPTTSIGGRQQTRVIKRVYRKRFTVRRRGGAKTLR